MATTDPVEIVVDIIDNTEKTLAKIEGHLERLDQMRVEPAFAPDVSQAAMANAMGAREVLERDIHPNVRFGMGLFPSEIDRVISPDIDLMDDHTPLFRRGTTGRTFESIQDSFRGLGRTLVSYRPTIMDWWNILALLIPIMFTLAGGAIAAAAAIGILGGAAAGIIGLGLLGWGDNLTESFNRVKKRAKALADTLFNVLRPAAVQMQPLLAEAMAQTPGQVQQVVDELADLTVFADTLSQVGTGFVDWFEDLLQRAIAFNDEISEIVLDLGRGFGDFLLDFLFNLIETLHNNQRAFSNLAKSFVLVMSLLFDLLKVVGFVIGAFRPLFEVAARVAQMMSSKWFAAILTFFSALFLGSFMVWELVGALIALSNIMFVKNLMAMASTLDTLALKTWNWFIAVESVKQALTRIAAIIATGVVIGGALSLASSVFNAASGAGRGGGGGGGVMNLTVNGDVRDREMHQIKDYMDERDFSRGA